MPGCAHCGKELTLAGRAAWMCGRIMGDEHCETVFFCPACGEHTLTAAHRRHGTPRGGAMEARR